MLVREIARETDTLAGGAPAVSQLRTTSFPQPGHRVPARVYTPTDGSAPFPALIYFHGGGWVFGDIDTHDSVCREIANRGRCVVISVGYRRAPEHKFPEPVDDCFGAVQWATDPATAAHLEIDPARVAVGGDSAGGTLAAVVTQLAKAANGPRLVGQVLICPVTAYYPDTASYRENATGFGLEESFMPWMWEHYLRTPADGHDPRVAPILAPDVSGLPPAIVITAECDLLRDEGERYAERLWKAGVPVKLTRYPGMVHGFIDYRGLVKEGWRALDEIGSWLRAVFSK
jgi:acetyl esterase